LFREYHLIGNFNPILQLHVLLWVQGTEVLGSFKHNVLK